MARYAYFVVIGALLLLSIFLVRLFPSDRHSQTQADDTSRTPEIENSVSTSTPAGAPDASARGEEKTREADMFPLPSPRSLMSGEMPAPAMHSIPFIPPPVVLPAAEPARPAASSSAARTSVAEPPPLPPLNEEAILRAVVKIECPSTDGRGKYVGSGFLLPKGVVVTAAHLVKESGSDTCRVIFSKDRMPAHYLSGITEDRGEVALRHDEDGIDVALLFMPVLAAVPEAQAIFPREYPFVPYPVCGEPAMLGDSLLHFGYPSNFLNQSYLSQAEGRAVAYADIAGIREQLSEDQTFLFKTPLFSYTGDQSRLHPYMVSRVATFYGDSGGLAFNTTKRCILGPHRGGTIGGGAGENFSVFAILGWQNTRRIIEK